MAKVMIQERAKYRSLMLLPYSGYEDAMNLPERRAKDFSRFSPGLISTRSMSFDIGTSLSLRV